MIGHVLTELELKIVGVHAERLLALGFPVNSAACQKDEAFAAFPNDWQTIVLADMQFMEDQSLGNDTNVTEVSTHS